MNGIFFILIWRADANTRTDITLCDNTKMCCLSHKGPAGHISQRPVCTARCAGFYTKDGS